MSDYDHHYWSKRIGKYLDEDWSSAPSPFVLTLSKYIEPKSKILELGCGAGQDGLWLADSGHFVTLTDADDSAFAEITARAKSPVDLTVLDITERFPFEDNSFDLVYAQLVLHYFDDEVTRAIIKEINRILKPGGILACMVNSTKDPEYDKPSETADGLISVGNIKKRYFNEASFQLFVANFDTILLDENGRTAKDDAVNNFGLVRFIGKKNNEQ